MTNAAFCTGLPERSTMPGDDTAESLRAPSTEALGRSAPLRRGERAPGTPWIVVRPLGKGGVGEVFEVEHVLLGRRAALKVLLPANAERHGLAERIADEGRILARVRHDNLVEVLDLGLLSDDGRPYLVLELLEGRDLRAELGRIGVLSVPTTLALASQILGGLGALHRAGFVHRDIKLENLFLCDDGRAKILDLGAAEPAAGGEGPGARGASLGTPRTMAPEQFAGKPVDGRADLYALGLVLYELVAGRGPFDDIKGIDALRFAHLDRTPPPPSRFAPQPIPAALDTWLLRALEKDPDDRFTSAEAMAAEIPAIVAPLYDPAARAVDVTTPSVFYVDVSRPSSPSAAASPRDSSGGEGMRRMVVSALAIASLAAGLAAGRLLGAPSSFGGVVNDPIASRSV
ncbi:serine/threonine-protein kinase [Polyangium mundeleinium]|uniref:Serine/threonine-protein kinase n=1 Tax=Polyangium mundeleinium TaxID=2995306 RepID=A0ABT5EH81_9BACT|nr:serine/threonine-protein kinase [Polyangium mundeleinium]MDC0740095.1 serine/threonine-protein kinase [Polyangium mundeleinium]